MDLARARENPFRSQLFADQVAIVTGGGTGIGRATAKELLALGCKVAIASRKPEHFEPTRAELVRETGAADDAVFAMRCDIREAAECEALVDAVKARWSRLDVLVNNAGGQFPSAAEAITPRGFEAVIRNNLNGTFYMTRAAADRAMLPQKRGVIINVIANIARGFPGMAHTGAARAGVDNLTKSLAVEWAQHDVRVNAVAPGIIESSGLEQYPPEFVEACRVRTPQMRFGSVDEVAHAIVYLASPAAAFITGATLNIDGGASLWGDNWVIPKR